MVKDDYIAKLYSKKCEEDLLYMSYLKRNTPQKFVINLVSGRIVGGAHGRMDDCISFVCDIIDITKKDGNQRFTSGKIRLIFPKHTGAIMFINSGIDIQEDKRDYELTVMIHSKKNYEIIKKEIQVDIFE